MLSNLCFRFLYGDQARFFSDEIHIDLKHSKTGTVAMASAGENLNASQVLDYFTISNVLPHQFTKKEDKTRINFFLLWLIIFELILTQLFSTQFYITLRDNLDYLDGKHTVSIYNHLLHIILLGFASLPPLGNPSFVIIKYFA